MAINAVKTQFFLEAMRDFNGESDLPITLAKVVEVKDEGYYVDVELVNKQTNMQKYQFVPVLKSKYVNAPILKDDLVILMTFSHLLQNYLEDKQFGTSIVFNKCYFALPLCYKDEFKHKNEFSVRSPNEKFIITLNEDDGILLKTEQGLEMKITLQDVELVAQNFKVNAKTAIELQSNTQMVIKAKSPLEIGTDSATLGGILQDLTNALLTLASATAGPTTPASPTLASDCAQILAKIAISFKA